MARYRTIKPEFWRSEQIVTLPITTRLLFIGMWNFCDDYGVMPCSDHGLKMAVFPNDDFKKDDIRRMVDELLANDLLQEYECDSRKYWFVTGWDRHQKPECKTGLYPRPDGNIGAKIRRKANSPNDSRTLAGHSRKEKGERIRKKEKVESIKSNSLPPSTPPVQDVPEKPKREGKPNPWFNICRSTFGYLEVQGGLTKKAEKALRPLCEELGLGPEEISRRWAILQADHPDWNGTTFNGLANHWHQCKERKVGNNGKPVSDLYKNSLALNQKMEVSSV